MDRVRMIQLPQGSFGRCSGSVTSKRRAAFPCHFDDSVVYLSNFNRGTERVMESALYGAGQFVGIDLTMSFR